MSAHKPKKSKRPMASYLEEVLSFINHIFIVLIHKTLEAINPHIGLGPIYYSSNKGVDFISNMPDEILQSILVQGLANTEEVVLTSALSKGLRSVLKSIPSLDLDCSRTKTFKKEEYKEFVSWALDNKTVDLDSFRLCCAGYYPMSTVCQWIDAAVKLKVKKLDLMVSGEDIVLPHCLLTCESLESLRLYLYGSRFKLPDCKGLSALKVLELNSVELPDFLGKWLEMCTSLEKLTLIDCGIHKKNLCYILEIKCPKLKTLIIHNHKGPSNPIGLHVDCPELVFFECLGVQIKALFILKKVESLKTAVILPQCTFHELPFCKLARISHVESLSLDCSSARYACDPEGIFPNLKTLELTTTFESDDMKLLKRILTCSPNLESIHLISHEVCYGSDRNFLSPCLERVEFLGFERGKWKLDIAGAWNCLGENGF